MKISKIAVLLFVVTVASSFAEEQPKEVQNLLLKRQEAVDRIDQRLVEELEKLKAEYMRSENLASANAVDALIKSSDRTVTNDSTDPIVGTTWNFLGVNDQKINEFRFEKGGKVRCESAYKDANWRRLDSKTILFGYHADGGYIVLYADDTGKFMTGLHKGGAKRSIRQIK